MHTMCKEGVSTMIKLLLFVIGCYIIAAAVVHIYYYISSRKQATSRHYVLLDNHQQDSIEWYYRSIKRFSIWMGIPIQVTVVNTEPGGDLRQMVDRWSIRHNDISLDDRVSGISEHTIVIDLSKQDDLCKLPF